jgi:hypothetical protein
MRRFVEIARTGASQQPGEVLGERETEYLARADSFYLATVGGAGWPYVQHRGGPRGFVRVLSPAQLGFADFGGNRQYLSVANAVRDDRASMIVVDYAARRRLKLLGHLRFIDIAQAGADLVRAVGLPGYPGRAERVALFDVAAFDWNCPQHITPRAGTG